MKKKGILHAELMKKIAALGHMDLFMIGDAGMPVPEGVEVIDLALCGGVPSFTQVLNAVLEETQIEFYYLAEEIQEQNKEMFVYVKEKMDGIPCEMMPHAELKRKSGECRFAIRTGEFSPYPNVILRAGVVF